MALSDRLGPSNTIDQYLCFVLALKFLSDDDADFDNSAIAEMFKVTVPQLNRREWNVWARLGFQVHTVTALDVYYRDPLTDMDAHDVSLLCIDASVWATTNTNPYATCEACKRLARRILYKAKEHDTDAPLVDALVFYMDRLQAVHPRAAKLAKTFTWRNRLRN